jgi:hypothetical protein
LLPGRDRWHHADRWERNTSAENEATVRRYVEEVYDQRKLEIIDELFASDFPLHDPDLPGGARGPEEIKRIVQTLVDAFPDLQVSLDESFRKACKESLYRRHTYLAQMLG